ncbi:hypothetical protein [Bradyrhizobium sp. Mp27]|uniref:hypothetical protein n=1 Tax=Bradyrhizobium sp. Mp27 TaxID=3042157 RepID=UPI00248C9A90|nr:hypothetical protein [Bradyrhizobium sp. Mp27]MDI2077402.1 hypothetical protein [Bradyrhizobium sp. Mp27]
MVQADGIKRITRRNGIPSIVRCTRRAWFKRHNEVPALGRLWVRDHMVTISNLRLDFAGLLDVFARVLALVLFALFGRLLWQAIAIGSADSSFQHVTLQITTLETSITKLEVTRREAEIRTIRFDSGVSLPDASVGSINEARQALVNAASDYRDEANRYFAAVCDAGKRLASIGALPGAFMPSTLSLKDCPKRSVNLPPGAVSTDDDPSERIQTVRAVLDHFNVLANSYMLPILFGMLGALTFAIRDIVTSPEKMGNLPVVTGYILRVFLGVILGLIIGYVNVTGTPAAGLAASPLLLSLVAGFATDAVLSLLDRIALAISYDRNVDAKNTPPPAVSPPGATPSTE